MTTNVGSPSPATADGGLGRALGALTSLLIPGEQIQAHALQRRLFALIHRRVIIGATTGRLIAVTRGLFGGFDPQDVRWQDLRDAQVRVGIFAASLTISVYGSRDLAAAEGPPRTLTFKGLRKAEAQEVYRACQAQAQAWREKRRVRELEELRAQSGGIQLGNAGAPGSPAGPQDEAHTPAARLQRAKDMLQQGLLSDAEFEQIKARILGDL
jgi:hypothetical protein